jgi:hypothetical protein
MKMIVLHGRLLRLTLGWLVCSALVTLLLRNWKTTDSQQAASAFLFGTMTPYFCGAFASGLILVWFIAFALASVFAATILWPQFQSRVRAQVSWGGFVLLSLLVMEFDYYLVMMMNSLFSWAHAEALAQEVTTGWLESLFGLTLSKFFAPIWLFLWFLVARETDATLRDSAVRRQQQRELEELLEPVFQSPTAIEPAIRTLPATEVKCSACQTTMSDRNRFCTRCGAPLSGLPKRSGGT